MKIRFVHGEETSEDIPRQATISAQPPSAGRLLAGSRMWCGLILLQSVSPSDENFAQLRPLKSINTLKDPFCQCYFQYIQNLSVSDCLSGSVVSKFSSSTK